jgi:CRP-like cAMP-binding protein
MKGKVETYRNVNGTEQLVARLDEGEFFGWQAVLNEKRRSVTVKCTESMDVLMLPKGDFNTIVMNLPQLRQTFDAMLEQRQVKRQKEPA